MKKLSSQDIDDLLADYYDGLDVATLSKFYKVSQGAVYYHLRIQAGRCRIENPLRYTDHIKNQIVIIQTKIKNGDYSEEAIPYAKSELSRLQYCLKMDRNNLPSDAFVLQ